MKHFLTFFGVLFATVLLAAVDAPSLRCVSVLPNNSIQITWIPPADPLNEFVEYELNFSTNIGGPYTKITIPGIATNQYVHAVNGAANSYYYYVETVYNAGGGNQNSAPSVTGQSMLPQFGVISDSTAIVNWNKVFDPNIPSSIPVYQVERMFGSGGGWNVIANPNYGNETANDAFKFCSDSVFYRISIADQSGCVSVSAVLKDLFEDNTPPATPIMDSVTVLPNQNARVDWKPSSSLDTRGYYVYYYFKPTAQYVPRDTILGRLNTGYEEVDPTIDTQVEYHDFTVAAFDSCTVPRINVSPGSPDQRTLHLSLIPNNCENKVELRWNSYINWDNLSGYQVLAARFGSPFDTVFVGGVNDTSYVFERPDGLTVYCFIVQALTDDGSKTSSSNLACSNASSAVVPKTQYFRQVTVEDNQYIKAVTLTDTSLPLSSYVLLRSLDENFGYFPVAEEPFTKSAVVTFADPAAKVTQNSYYYRVGLIDSCGVTVYRSSPVRSIYLTGEMQNDSLTVMLDWNRYNGWDSVQSGVVHYRILSVFDGQKAVIDSVYSGQTDYTLNLTDDIENGANLCFEIEAVEDSGNVFGYADTVRSNRVCFNQNTVIHVPNAFRPSGTNNIFMPVITFGDLKSYKMVIYNRWGQEVFETTNADQGWDGTINGQAAPIGAYVYVIQVNNFSGSVKEQSGTFVLVN